ncbi:Uncharacterised protein [Klebsiella pneumoniae]|uniref:Uncharacterized protein n=1 Tax=Klebsiella pneumoniae TaxID=573 RepID=A0A378BIE3_KLEPN|nr:Uncharacterised protein [Klebsiella pneumoniae]
MITTAILWKKTSRSSGARPSTVVKAVSRIGRRPRGCRINNSLSLIFLLFLLLYLFYQHNAVTDQHTAQG